MNAKFTSLLCVVVSVLHTNIATAQINAQDSLALVDLYNSTNGAAWKNSTNWLTALPVKQWRGIRVSGKRVTQIVLHKNNLVGTLPASLGNISNLQYLDLYTNQLSGSIPASLGNLLNLQTLLLYDNKLTDTIPSSLGDLSNLQNLDLDRNKLSGSIPPSLGNLDSLLNLNLQINQLSGAIPASFANLSGIQNILLGANQLTDTIPAFLGDLSTLLALNLEFNQLTGSIPASLGNLTQLQALNLGGNKLTGSIPASLGKLSNLLWFYLRGNQLTGSIPSSFGKLSNCGYLYLNDNQLSGKVPSSIDSLPAYLYIYNNKFTFAGMEGIAQRPVFCIYAPQANIPLIQNGNILSVEAGGTLSNNTYKWYKNGVLVKTKTGNKNFGTTGAGQYYVVVTNSIAIDLTLYSDTITIAPVAANKKFDENIYANINSQILLYPNPVQNNAVLAFSAAGKYSVEITDKSGKVLQIKTGVAMQSQTKTGLNLSGYTAGIYTVTIIDEKKLKRSVQLVKE